MLPIASTASAAVPVQTNTHHITGFMPDANVIMVPGARHYTFVDTCMPAVADRFANHAAVPHLGVGLIGLFGSRSVHQADTLAPGADG
jgi:predicted dienelactone hydrolase